VAPSSIDDWGGPAHPSHWSIAWNREYAIDPAHTYSATLFACAGGGDFIRDALLDVEVRPVIPAPRALLLAVTGAALVGWRRRSAAR